jgi:hypothetical protein
VKLRLLALLLTGLFLFIPGTHSIFAGPDFTRQIYADALAPGWLDWSWVQNYDLEATAPVHSGGRSIAVTFGPWEGLRLHKFNIDTLGTTHLRFFIHGGATGGQSLVVYLDLDAAGNPQSGPAIPFSPPPANAWAEVLLPLSVLNPNNKMITGITWQDWSGANQPTLYIDDIALVSTENPEGPQLSEGSLHPRSVLAGSTASTASMASLVVRARLSDPQGTEDIAALTLDASDLGVGSVPLHDDGRSNDGSAADGVYGAVLSVATGTLAGEHYLMLTASDKAGHSTYLPLGALNVLAPPGGDIPPALPQRIGWGSNAWDEHPGDDWQVNSGVAWDYVYQYITHGWESWGGNFVEHFVQQAWEKDFVPMVVVYMLIGVPPDCGEGGPCYAQKLQNVFIVSAYLASLERAAQEAAGSEAVIFNLEPDFYGYMQQLSNADDRLPGILPDDPASIPVALNKGGYANNLAGFGRYVVDMIHATAPNALVAPMASTWATGSDPQSVTAPQAMQMAQRVAAFINAMGGAQADLLVVEWSDRDAGSGLRPWWDDADQETPRPTRAILWENTLSQATQKRLFLWQVPVGNLSLDNTCGHYQDNRAAYAFTHPRDLFDAGVIGVLFGGGAECMTQVWTDGGFVAAQGAIAYDDPAAPGGLAVTSSIGGTVSLRWDENDEPDLWKYRLLYRSIPGGSSYGLDAGRSNFYRLHLPQSGVWEIHLAAIDAMGYQSLASTPVMVTTTVDAKSILLPIVVR